MAEQRATDTLRRMVQFGKTLPLDDQRSMAKGLRMTKGTLTKLESSRELLEQHNQRLAQAQAISLAAWQLIRSPTGDFSAKSVRADIVKTKADIERLEASINEDCAAMEGILSDNKFPAK
ncbi:hypothetical protein IWQ56_006906 [Coemansia nantahalensis]|uniref:Uncharacterized protein n=1 Tax=Coemansia helicoidea TaxID=1286919 RepID=A0ACC1L7C4_9FUNG|nr:hypothetical protein IWQ56_006906 [Coemansia nantahalensis]KAJ2802901.1 hypothetical protein H4R21_002241 [Coemansia helicoidea]